MSHCFSPHSCRISKSVPPNRAGSLLDNLYQVISQPMLAVQKNCKWSKSLFDIPLQSSLWGLFCGTPLEVIFWLLYVANLPGFSYMPNCITSYLSINLENTQFITQDFIVIACDGLWDTVSPDAAKDSVFKSLKDNKGRKETANGLSE